MHKRAMYGDAARTSDMLFTPLVIDMGGAWGKSAIPLFQDLAASYATQRWVSKGVAVATIFTSFSTLLHKHAAKICLIGLRGTTGGDHVSEPAP